MIRKVLALGFMAALPAMAQYVTRAWFPDGAEVQVRAETTAGTKQAVPGGGGVTDGRLFRLLQDQHYDIVFTYQLEAAKVPGSDAVNIRIRPDSRGKPTFSKVLEFPAVKIGQEVKVEILSNPATGEKVYDIIRPADEPNPYPGTCNVRCSVEPDFTRVKLVVNGKAQWLENFWTPGKPPLLYVPGQGTYFLSWESRPKYRLAGYLEKNRLIFLMDSQYVEMTFPGNVMPAADGGPVWIYHDPGFVPEQGRDTCLLDSYR